MLHIYHGNGKGKTTAAVGLAVRAAGAGMKVLLCQFLKDGTSSEISVLRDIPGIEVRACECCDKFTFQMNEDELSQVRRRHDELLNEAAEFARKEGSAVILDELLDAYNMGLLDTQLADRLILGSELRAELVLTGRDPLPEFIQRADYVSEISAVKHPFESGTAARKGIEY